MGIVIGAKPEGSFEEPLRLLSDCHRRIERFLEQMILVTERVQGGALEEKEREALEVALRYFRKAAPLHTLDEEASLFPRLRAVEDAEVAAALQALEALEADHDTADRGHEEADALGRRWLEAGRLSPEETERLSRTLHELKALYTRHIAVEDTRIFPLAGRVLESAEVRSVGKEMAARRGIGPQQLGRQCPSSGRPVG